jgi:kynurenine formamidase
MGRTTSRPSTRSSGSSGRSRMNVIVAQHATPGIVTRSPFGPDDEQGMLNHLTPELRGEVTARIDASRMYDLAVEFFPGMPEYLEAQDQPYQICLCHTPAGTLIDGGAGIFQTDVVGYSGDSISLYTHIGTHFDALNHIAYGQTIWNGFSADKYLGSRHWHKCGADKIPPVVTRGLLLDVPKALGVDVLPPSFAIGRSEVEATLAAQGVELQLGDVCLFRTGRMTYWPDPEGVTAGYKFPGLNLEGAQALAERGVVAVGTDCMTPEQAPSAVLGNPAPVHSYLLAACGVVIIENLWLEDLAADEVYEFVFVAAPLKLRGATGTPARPLAFPWLAR